MSEENSAVDGNAIEAAKIRFADFLEANVASSIEMRKLPINVSRLEIVRPWGDTSLALHIPEDETQASQLAEALNNVLLPPRLIALWHKDKRALEVIWTAYRLSTSQAEIKDRKFTFTYKNTKHICHFTKASTRLQRIAKSFRPITQSPTTNFRNLTSFYRYATAKNADQRSLAGLEEPLSFWISNIKWNENSTIIMLDALNFYMSYFDDDTPIVVINDPINGDGSSIANKARYIRGSFPSEIISRELNRNLVSFWMAALAGNPAMRFILYFRIIEYASHHYLDDKIRADVKKLLSKPDFYDDLNETIDEIVGACTPSKQDDVPKFKNLLRRCVSPDLLWAEIKRNQEFFAKETKFDGGFVVQALISKDEKQSTFSTNGTDRVADRLREIRNTLSHGRDVKTGHVITPTARNFQLLKPWIHLIGTAAAEVVLHERLS